jgi:hypothetical protein
MPRSRIRLVSVRVTAVTVMTGVVLGLLPPAMGQRVPATVVRKISIDTGRLLPPRSAAALRSGGGVRLRRPAWSPRAVACAPIRFTMVGFAWRQDGGEDVPTRVAWGTPGGFGAPVDVVADPSEGPDPSSPDDASLDGTPGVWTGEARCVRLRMRFPADETIAGVRAVFVNTSGTAERPSLLDRAAATLASIWGMARGPFTGAAAGASAAQPTIIPRSGWGAKESLRRCGPDYADDGLKMAYIHHTVNSNSYPPGRADDLIRGMYAYHVNGRHFCDIAYNFLIDRFGRIYEGRYGGIDQPVIGAHAMGFNTGSTGVAALGTFTSTKAPRTMLRAYKHLFAWRLDVAHLRPTGKAVMISAGGSNQRFEKGQVVTLPVIAGHRDTGYTTCPGSFLQRKLAPIRRDAEARGLPKLWNPARSAEAISLWQQQTVQFTATLSETMNWTVDITDSLGAAKRQFSGSGTLVDATWDGRDSTATPVAPGVYTVTMRAQNPGGQAAREAVLSVTVNA